MSSAVSELLIRAGFVVSVGVMGPIFGHPGVFREADGSPRLRKFESAADQRPQHLDPPRFECLAPGSFEQPFGGAEQAGLNSVGLRASEFGDSLLKIRHRTHAAAPGPGVDAREHHPEFVRVGAATRRLFAGDEALLAQVEEGLIEGLHAFGRSL